MEAVTFFYFILSFALAIIITLTRWIITKRLPHFGCLFILFMLIFSCFYSYIYTFLNRLPSANYVPDVVLEDLNISNIHIVAKTQITTIKNQSQEVSLDITDTMPHITSSHSPSIPTITIAQPVPIGTPQVSIQKAFGPNYDVSATAQLAASAFDIDPNEQPEQSLDQRDRVSFVWTITPKFSGPQILYISVTGIWFNGKTTIERPLGDLTLEVNVDDPPPSPPPPSPFINLGQINASEIIMVFLGSALNVQWIWGLVQERRKAKKQKKQSSSPSQKKLPTRRGKTKKVRKV